MNRLKLIGLSMLVGLLWLTPLQAQETENEGIARAVMITPKAGHTDTLLTAIKDYHKWVANFEGHHRYTWYAILTGPNTGKFLARTGNHNWADFDAEYDWQEEAGEVFRSNVRPHIEQMEVQFTSPMNEFSHRPESYEGFTHFAVQDWYVKNGHWGKFRRGLGTIVGHLKAGGFKGYFTFYNVESGGYGGQVRLVSPNKGWADMADSDPSFASIMIEALGGEEQFEAFMADWSSTFKQGANWMVRRMAEASDYGD